MCSDGGLITVNGRRVSPAGPGSPPPLTLLNILITVPVFLENEGIFINAQTQLGGREFERPDCPGVSSSRSFSRYEPEAPIKAIEARRA